MFTGIVEEIGKVSKIQKSGSNIDFTITAKMTPELKIDQSVSHNGVCLTVVSIDDTTYTVTAVNETLEKTNLGKLDKGDMVNLERGMKLGDRLDGHIVQGHVDQTAICKEIKRKMGAGSSPLNTMPKLEILL